MPVDNLLLSKGEKPREMSAYFLYGCDIVKLGLCWNVLISYILKASSKYVHL